MEGLQVRICALPNFFQTIIDSHNVTHQYSLHGKHVFDFCLFGKVAREREKDVVHWTPYQTIKFKACSN